MGLRALGQIKGRDHPRRRDAGFHALRSQHRGHEAVLVAFDLIERDGEDLRELPLIERKRRLARLVGKTKNWLAIQYGEHLKGNGASVLAYVCRLELEGIVSKWVDAPRLAKVIQLPAPTSAASRVQPGNGCVWLSLDPSERPEQHENNGLVACKTGWRGVGA